MEALRQYVISVAAAGIICGIVNGLSQKSSAQSLLKLVTGLFLVITVVRPVLSFDFSQLMDLQLTSSIEANEAAAIGENISQNAMREIIKSETEAYILDKASELNTGISANVAVSNDPLPVPISVTLSGTVSAAARVQLEQVITEDLGIPKENQQWIGQD